MSDTMSERRITVTSWLPDDKQDALFERVSDAAHVLGEDVTCSMGGEDYKARAEAAEAKQVAINEALTIQRDKLRDERRKVARVEALATKFEHWPSGPSFSVTARAIRAALKGDDDE